ncbi:Ail/Lom family outer membrane beta-barrel protein [Photobacterium alginatilyticum]|nr:Ail/Lom family outer membrane beta-barrel protein [Photobacterium alginatilyticum]
MKKTQQIIVALLVALSLPTLAFASEHTIVAGAVKTNVDSASEDLYGFNVKYRYEGSTQVGLIASVTLSGRSSDRLVADMQAGKLAATHTDTYGYAAVTAGPIFRINRVISLYSTVGYAGYFMEIEDKKSNSTYRVIDEKMVAAGLGLQANITRNFVADASYEYVPFGSNNDSGTFALGLGYRF